MATETVNLTIAVNNLKKTVDKLSKVIDDFERSSTTNSNKIVRAIDRANQLELNRLRGIKVQNKTALENEEHDVENKE